MNISGKNLRKITAVLNRSPSTIRRELKRDQNEKEYWPSVAQQKYQQRRKRCKRTKLLKKDVSLAAKVRFLLEQYQWFPEKISHRLKLEGQREISYSTIYRALKSGIMEPKGRRNRKTKGRYPLERHLRRKNRPNGGHTNRSPFSDAPTIHD